MTVYSKRNIVFTGPDGQKFRLKKDYIGPVPEWVAKSAYLKALAADKDKKVVITEEAKKKPPKPQKPPEWEKNEKPPEGEK